MGFMFPKGKSITADPAGKNLLGSFADDVIGVCFKLK